MWLAAVKTVQGLLVMWLAAVKTAQGLLVMWLAAVKTAQGLLVPVKNGRRLQVMWFHQRQLVSSAHRSLCKTTVSEQKRNAGEQPGQLS